MICAKKLAKYYFENPLTLKDSFKFTIYDVQDKSIIWTNDFQNLKRYQTVLRIGDQKKLFNLISDKDNTGKSYFDKQCFVFPCNFIDAVTQEAVCIHSIILLIKHCVPSEILRHGAGQSGVEGNLSGCPAHV